MPSSVPLLRCSHGCGGAPSSPGAPTRSAAAALALPLLLHGGALVDGRRVVVIVVARRPAAATDDGRGALRLGAPDLLVLLEPGVAAAVALLPAAATAA